MSEVIDLKPGVDYFESKRVRRARRAGIKVAPRRAIAKGGVGKRMPVSIDLSAIIDTVSNPLVRNLLNVAAQEFMRVRG